MVRALLIILPIYPLLDYGQPASHTPIKIIILKPDTAIIDKTLRNDIDSIEIEHLKLYYTCAKGSGAFEKDFSSSKYPTLESLKQNESFFNLPTEVRQFKFFHLISEYSKQIYEFYFSQKQFPSEIVEMPGERTDLSSLKELADRNRADYVVFFHNIHTVMRDSSPVLRVTTALYSSKETRLLLDSETESNSISLAASRHESEVMWSCNPRVTLQCLFINSVRSSTQLVSDILLGH